MTERAADAVVQRLLRCIALARLLARQDITLVDRVLRQNRQPGHRVRDLERQAGHGLDFGDEAGEVVPLRQVDDFAHIGNFRAGGQVLLQVFDEIVCSHRTLLGVGGGQQAYEKGFFRKSAILAPQGYRATIVATV